MRRRKKDRQNTTSLPRTPPFVSIQANAFRKKQTTERDLGSDSHDRLDC